VIWHTFQTKPNNDWRPPGAWDSLEGVVALTPPIVARNADGRLEVFVLEDASGNLWHTWQTKPGVTGAEQSV
jgi:hypothetical protein